MQGTIEISSEIDEGSLFHHTASPIKFMKKILVIEDNQEVRKIFPRSLIVGISCSQSGKWKKRC